MPNKPTVLLVATYDGLADAEADYRGVMDLHKAGQLGHVSAAVLTKDEDGKLKVHRHDTTAKHLAWGGAFVGGLIGALVPPLGLAWLAGAAVDGAVLAGVGGAVGHFWENIPKSDLAEFGAALDQGQSALVVVAVDKELERIEAATERAVRRVAKKLEKGDLEGAYEAAAKAAGAAEA